jgi:hypothetical protein
VKYSFALLLLVQISSAFADYHGDWNSRLQILKAAPASCAPYKVNDYDVAYNWDVKEEPLRQCIFDVCGEKTFSDPKFHEKNEIDDGKSEVLQEGFRDVYENATKTRIEAESKRIDRQIKLLKAGAPIIKTPEDAAVANLSKLFYADAAEKISDEESKEKINAEGEFYGIYNKKLVELAQLPDKELKSRLAVREKQLSNFPPAQAQFVGQYISAAKEYQKIQSETGVSLRSEIIEMLNAAEASSEIFSNPSAYPFLTKIPKSLNATELEERLLKRKKNLNWDIADDIEKCFKLHERRNKDAYPPEKLAAVSKEFKDIKADIAKNYLSKLSNHSRNLLTDLLSKTELALPASKKQLALMTRKYWEEEIKSTREEIELIESGQRDQIDLAVLYGSKASKHTSAGEIYQWCSQLHPQEGTGGLARPGTNIIKIENSSIKSGITDTLNHEVFHILDPSLNRIKLSQESQSLITQIKECINKIHANDSVTQNSVEDWADAGSFSTNADAGIQSWCNQIAGGGKISSGDFQIKKVGHSPPITRFFHALAYSRKPMPPKCQEITETLKKSGIEFKNCFKDLK